MAVEAVEVPLSSDGFIDVAGASDFLKLSRATIYSLMERGEIPYAKFGKSRRIPRRALQEFAEKNLVVR